MDENKIYDTLNNETKKVDIPTSLKPENIIDKLGEQIVSISQASSDVVEANRELQKTECIKQPKPKKKRFIAIAGGIAAVIATVIVGVNVRNMYLDKRADSGLVDITSDNIFKTLSSYEELAEYVKSKNDKFELGFGFGEIADDMAVNGGSNNLTGALPEDSVDMEEYEGMEKPTTAVVDKDTSTPNDSNENAPDENDSNKDYSDTNVRTEGVLEADCVKTDGEYIFAIAKSDGDYDSGDTQLLLDIIKADGENTEYIAQYDLNKYIVEKLGTGIGYYYIDDMILYDDKLIVIGSMNLEAYSYKGHTIIAVFDRNDELNIELMKCFTVSGDYSQCRMNNGYLYVISNYNIDLNNIEPQVDGEAIKCGNIYISECDEYRKYMIFTAFNMKEEPSYVSDCAVVNDGYPEIYASNDNIYLITSSYKDGFFNSRQIMNIMKFTYDEGKVTPKASLQVDGWLDDIFCIDEYNGYLRIVVTSAKNGEEINTLYVFDSELKETGKIEDIAPRERIYSARFDGDIGYFVTFEQIDPLFSVDLSDPANPKIVGELKIPGFSEYMHMWSEDKMLGVGKEDGNVKLSMFDISDPHNVKEEDKTILQDIYNSEALYNHKAILVNSSKNIIGFCADGLNYVQTFDYGYVEQGSFYFIYAYENETFVLKQAVSVKEMNGGQVRGMYIGNYIYVVETLGNIKVISLDNFEVVKTAIGK